MKRQGFKIDEKLIEQLRKRGKRTGQSICWQVERAVKKDLKENP